MRVRLPLPNTPAFVKISLKFHKDNYPRYYSDGEILHGILIAGAVSPVPEKDYRFSKNTKSLESSSLLYFKSGSLVLTLITIASGYVGSFVFGNAKETLTILTNP